MAGETALDTSMAIRYLNSNPDVMAKVTSLPIVVLPLTVVGELLFGAENSARPLTNITRYSLLILVLFCRWDDKQPPYTHKLVFH